MSKLFPVEKTNPNRSKAGSVSGKDGRAYPKFIVSRLKSDEKFLNGVCQALGHSSSDFADAIAGDAIPSSVSNIVPQIKKKEPKTSFRIVWKDKSYTNIRTKPNDQGQIHLEKVDNFIAEYKARYGAGIPSDVKLALLLFVGGHNDQEQILNSIPVSYAGDDRVRDLERRYHNRLTLASMYGYDDKLPPKLLKWLAKSSANLFAFCFREGADGSCEWMPHYLWYYQQDNWQSSEVKLYDLEALTDKISKMSQGWKQEHTAANDPEHVGSTIALPFGDLQYHKKSLQFRHDPAKLQLIQEMSVTKNKFGAAPKKLGHMNEEKVTAELNGNSKFRKLFCNRVGHNEQDFLVAETGGIRAAQEIDVFGKKTIGKTDVCVKWRDGSWTNISIKMSPCGQAYLVSASKFVDVFEAQYKVQVPTRVRQALMFFTGENPESKAILYSTSLTVDGEESRKVAEASNYRLMFKVIENYNPIMAAEFLAFLKKQLDKVFELSFAAGAVKDRRLWSDVLWYINLVQAERIGLNRLASIPVIKTALILKGEDNVVESGTINSGSAIQLPFGRLQYHQKKLEFYHVMNKLQQLVEFK